MAEFSSSIASEEVENRLLIALADGLPSSADSWSFSVFLAIPHQQVVGVARSLEVGQLVTCEPQSSNYLALSDEALLIIRHGSPEFKLIKSIPEAGSIPKSDLIHLLGDDMFKIGFGCCMKNGWIRMADGIISLHPDAGAGASIVDSVQVLLNRIHDSNGSTDCVSDVDAAMLKKRKLVVPSVKKYLSLRQGAKFRRQRVDMVSELTSSLIESGAWRSVQFKPYNFAAMGNGKSFGCLHPLLKVRDEFKRILMEMGFEEMPTDKWVESSFWNFDVLFQPQSHPARDAHDTFFIADPQFTVNLPQAILADVRTMHEVGGHGSLGYRYSFNPIEANRNILRTHTTAISAQMLYRLSCHCKDTGRWSPCKLFSIDRVFRNEAMDSTHLCEFHQVEGLVADYNLSLSHLISTIRTFFSKIGITQIRFKPAYNPYTEPSMEIFGYHPDLKKWTEIGNSGVFRPEMLLPIGLPKDVRVIAWGLSLERPTMIKYRIENIRELFGHKVDIEGEREAPIARFIA